MPTPIFIRPHLLRDSLFAVAKPDTFIHGITSITCPDDLAAQTQEVLNALDLALAEAGSHKSLINHIWITLGNGAAKWTNHPVPHAQLHSDYTPPFRSVYEAWVSNPPPPRTLTWGSLDKKGAYIEVSAIASRRDP